MLLCSGNFQAEKMVGNFEELGTALGDMGMALIKIAKYEDEEGARTGAYTDSSTAAKDISANSRRVGMVRCAAGTRCCFRHSEWGFQGSKVVEFERQSQDTLLHRLAQALC
jgi:hypothetical protein